MKVEQYKGHDIIVLEGEGDREVRLGLNKAKTILMPDNLAALRGFVLEYDKPKAEPKPEPAPAPATADLAKQLADLQAQLAALKAGAQQVEQPAVKPVEKSNGRFAVK